MLEIIACPQCGAPAEITERCWLDPTGGPIQHLQGIFLSKHWLTRGPRRSTGRSLRPDHDLATLSSCSVPAQPAVRASTAGE